MRVEAEKQRALKELRNEYDLKLERIQKDHD
jgi:hypothetical protein